MGSVRCAPPHIYPEHAGGYGDTFPSAFPAGQPALDSMPLLGAGERAGIYRVIVRKPGYAEWIGAAIVTEDECHVRPTTLTARLQPQR